MNKYAVLPALIVTLAATTYAASSIQSGNYKFEKFQIPNSHNLFANAINDFGSVVGDYAIQQGAVQGFIRSWDGHVTTLIDPADKGGATAGYTLGYGINIEGTVVGQFYNTAAAQYSGFFYNDGTYTNYNLPGLPTGSATGIYGLNDVGTFCGYY